MPKKYYSDEEFWDEAPEAEGNGVYTIDGYVYTFDESTDQWVRD